MPERQVLLQQIDAKLDELGSAYGACQGLFLTEDDLKCFLYSKLAEIPGLLESRPTRDLGVLAPRLHAELTWFDDDDRLSIKPDLTILEPRNLRVGLGSGPSVRLPSKGYEFEGNAVVFELKFVRNQSGLTTNAASALRKDIEKIRRLLGKHDRLGVGDSLFCYFVVISKIGRECPEFTSLVATESAEPRFRFVVRSADAQLMDEGRHVGA